MPLGLLDRLQRILPFANTVVDKIVCEETDLLEIIPRMYEVMHRAAEISYDYVTRGRSSPDEMWEVLIITARTAGESAYQEKIKEIDNELMRIVEDFDRAVNVEALRRIKETGEQSFSPILHRLSSTVPRRATPFA